MKIVFLLILVIILLFGCTEMTREEKNICDSLTSQSFDYIPFCDNEKECYARVNNLFKTDFKIETDNDLYHFKNRLARSWYYYNKAVLEIKKIKKECDEKNPNKLPGLVNQTKYYLSQSFEELDNAIKTSFEIIKKEKEYLNKEEIELIKEEKVYDSYISFEQILLEISSKNYKSDSYASFYNKKIEKFKNSTSYLPKNLIEEDSILFKISNLSSFFPEEIEKIEEKIKIFSFSESFDNIFNYFKNWFFTKESLDELKKLPAKELMVLYTDVAGEKNSVIENFFELINNYSKNYSELKNEEDTLKNKVEESYKNAEEEINNQILNEDIYFLQKELFSENITSNSNIKELFSKTKNELITFRQEDLKKTLSYGRKFSKLKDLKNSFDFIYQELLKTNIQSNKKIFEKCREIANDNLKLKNQNIELNYLYDNLLFNSNLLNKKNSLDEALCKKVIELKSEYLEGLNSIELLKAKQIDSTKECFSYLEIIFSKIKLYELEKMFLILKDKEVTTQNLYYFKESCENIKLQVENEIKDQSKIKSLEDRFGKLQNIKNDFELLVSFFNSKQKTNMDKVDQEINFLNKYRLNNSFDIIKVIGIEDELIKRIDEKINLFEIELKKEKLKEIIDNIKFESTENIVFNKEISSNLLITITNPFETINEEISFSTPFEVDLNENNLVKDYFKGSDKTLITTNNIPKGKTYIYGTYNTKLDFEIKNTILYASNKNSVIENKIIIKNNDLLKKAFFEIKSIPNNKIIITHNGEEQDFVENNRKLSFLLENVSKDSDIKIYFYANELITLTTKNINIKNIDEKTQIIEKEIIVKNNYEEKLTADLLIDFINNFNVLDVSIYDEEFVNKRISFIDDYILLKNIEFFDFEEKKFLLISKINNPKEYYINILDELKNKIIEIDYILYNKINNHINLDYSENWVKTSEDLINSANNIIMENDILNQKEAEINLIKNDLNEKINYLTTSLDELEKLGFYEDYEKLREVIISAQDEIKSNDLDDLTKLLINLNDLNFSVNKVVLKELNKIEEYLNSNDFSNNLFYEKEELLEKIKNLKNIKTDPLKLNQEFLEIQKIFNNFKLDLENFDKLLDEESDYLLNIIKDSLNLINLIKKELSFNDEELIKIRFVKPITNTRLDKLEKKLNELNESDLINEKSDILNIYNELNTAYNKIRLEAIKRYNIAIDNDETESKLLSAKENIDNNNFVNAMFSLASDTQANNINIVGILPIVIIVLMLIIFSFYNKKKNKENELSKNKFEEIWRD